MATGITRYQVASNDQLDQEEREIFESAQGLQENRATALPSNLSAHVRMCWQASHQTRSRNKIDEVMLQCFRQREGIYDPEAEAEIAKLGGSKIYMMLTDVKCRAFEAWARDVLLPPGEKPWAIEPTPYPDLPDDVEAMIAQQVMQESVTFVMRYGPMALSTQIVAMRIEEIRSKALVQYRKYAEMVTQRFETKVEDDFQEGGFYKAINQFISDLATYPAAFIKGPVLRKRPALTWQQDRNGGNPIPIVKDVIKTEYQRVSPFDCFPSPSARSVKDGYFIERMRMRLKDLQGVIGVDGFKEEEVRAVLQEAEGGAAFQLITVVDPTREDLERRDEWMDPEGMIDCLNYWGWVQGTKLREYGLSGDAIPDPDLYYQANVWDIGGHTIMARLNPHPLGDVPYYSSSFQPKNDSIWGKSPPMAMRASAQAANGAARAMMNNASVASGPQVVIDMSRIEPGMNIYDIVPWKVWLDSGNKGGTDIQAVRFFMPTLVVKELLGIYQWASEEASEESGIPNSIYGGQGRMGSGAADTASGYAMISNSANKTLGGVIFHVDENVTAPAVKNHWLHLMLYDQTIQKAGDINVVARASRYLIVAEQIQLRLNEFARTTNNPTDLQIIGIEGRAELLREMAKFLRTKSDKIVPTEERMRARMLEQAGMVNQENGQTGPSRPTGQGGQPRPGQKQIPEKGAAATPDGRRPGEESGRMMQPPMQMGDE